MTVYLNSRLVADDEARIDPTDRGLTLGDGLFETIAVRGRRAARTDAHLARLSDGAEVIGLAIPLAGDELKAALQDVIEANAIDEGVLRLTLTRGPAPRGLWPPIPAQPTLLITGACQDLTSQEPVTAVIATTTRRNEHSPLSGIKSTSCLDGILAAREAAKRGANDASLLNGAGVIVISSFISPYEEDRQSAGKIIGDGFMEVFVDAPIDVCESRDPKGLYEKARAGEIGEFTGISAPYEAPSKPDLHLRTDQMTPEESAQKILEFLREGGKLH